MDEDLYFFDIYAGALKMSDTFVKGSKSAKLSYDFSHPKLALLRKKYLLDKVAGAGTDFDKATKIMFWLTKNVFHAGDYDNGLPSDSLNLLEHSFSTDKKNGINCRALAVILTECLLALGIYARTVYMMPLSPYDEDNHVVTHAYLSEKKSWVMLDPTFNCYASDENKNPLNLLQIRALLADKKHIFFNKEINYNGQKKLDYVKNKISLDAFYHEYFAKNLYYLETFPKSCYGADKLKNKTVYIISPVGFDLFKRVCSNIEYRIAECKDPDTLKKLNEHYNKIKAGGALRRRVPLSPDALLAVN